ncbi:GvpL/GvpF family gas vesicle protein [Streptomyces echinatus]|uniref:GvpL/GvpF family gas vesicle protein n=1 Tax=Streptomyces echinatus TaxID=67293 RepID=UPI003803692E
MRPASTCTGWLANLSFQVKHGSAEQFLATVDEFRPEHPHLELRVNGPLPPYSFVDTLSSAQAEGGTSEAFGAAAAQPNG